MAKQNNTSEVWRRHLVKTTYTSDFLMCKLHNQAMELCQKANVIFEPWHTAVKLNELLIKTTREPYFRDYWANRLVSEFSHMIWNCVYNYKRKEMNDKKATKLADQITEKFCKSFS